MEGSDLYTKRELDNEFLHIKGSLDRIETSVGEVDTKVSITNGKVADIQTWRQRLIGASWVGGFLITIVIVPLLTWAFVTVSRIGDQIKQGIQEELSVYNIEIK